MSRSIVSFFTRSRFDYKSSLINYKYYNVIRDSGLFDKEFYANTYDDVSGDELTHFLVKGLNEGKLPSLEFDSDFYLKTYPDVKQAHINPLLHYVAYGKNEGKIIQNSYCIRRKD